MRKRKNGNPIFTYYTPPFFFNQLDMKREEEKGEREKIHKEGFQKRENVKRYRYKVKCSPFFVNFCTMGFC